MSEWSGLKEFTEALKIKSSAVDHNVGEAVELAALELEAGAKAQFTQSHAAGTPTPSTPGTPPAVITGTMRRSYHTEGPVRLGFGKYTAVVGPSAIYARVQELGGDTGIGGATHLPARPVMERAYAEWLDEDRLSRRLAAAVTEGLKA